MNFKENLKNLRSKKGYTQEFLAKLLNLNSRTYLSYEHGEREPRFSTLELMTKILECDYNELLK